MPDQPERNALPDDQWTWERMSSPSELRIARERSLREVRIIGSPEYADKVDKEGFTCDDCSHAALCVLAFDSYNTNGDCLLEK